MSDQRIQSTERMVGANHPTLSDTLNRLALVGHNLDGSHKAGVNSIDCSQYASLDAAIAAIGSTVTMLTISTTVNVLSNLTVPSTLDLVILNGGLISNSTHTIAINGLFYSGLQQCFSGSGAITFGVSSTNRVYPEWWGALGDGITNSSSAITSAITSLNTGGEVQFSSGIYLFNVTLNKSNITISGVGRSSTGAKGGVGGTIFQAYSTASPVLQIGDGTNWTQMISFHGFSLNSTASGAIANNDGIKIYGAEQVYGYDFSVLGFGGNNINITSSATKDSSGVKLSFFDSSYAWGSNYIVTYGATYVTDVAISNFHMTGRNYTGAYSIYLTGGVILNVNGGYVDTGGNRQGHVYLNSIHDILVGNMVIDASYGGVSTDISIETTQSPQSYPSNMLNGCISWNHSFLWGDASTTVSPTDGAYELPYNSRSQQLRAGNLVIMSGAPNISDAATDSVINMSSGSLWIYNNQSGAQSYIKMASNGVVQIAGAGSNAGQLVVVSITASNSLQLQAVSAGSVVNNSLYIDAADNKLKWKGNSGTVTPLANP